MKARAHFEQGPQATTHPHFAPGGNRDARKDLQEGAFARPIPTHKAHHLAPTDVEGDIGQGPDLLRRGGAIGPPGRQGAPGALRSPSNNFAKRAVCRALP